MTRYPYRFLERPRFLLDCFNWKGRGYHYAGLVPDEIYESQARKSEDPWVVLASVLESAKRGDYTGVALLKKWVRDEYASPMLVSACLDVIADAGLKKDLEFLAELMIEGPDYLRIASCQAAQWAGSLWLLPFMLDVWQGLKRRADRDAVEANISNLLESENGEPLLFVGSHTDDDYMAAVNVRVDDLKSAAGSDDVAIFGGEPIDMGRQIWAMRRALMSRHSENWVNWGSFLLWRRKLETYTGLDCSGFYGGKGEFQPLNATAVLDRCLAAGNQIEFKVGERYFFGKMIPRE